MKLVVETNGAYQLADVEVPNGVIRHEGYTVVDPTGFVNRVTGFGQLSVKGQVNDEATDEEWLTYVSESKGDLQLALEAFQSAYPLEVAEKPAARAKR